MTPLETFESKLLYRLGYYNIAPFLGPYLKRWCYQESGKFHIIDGNLSEEKRERILPSDIVLLSLNEDGYRVCTPSSIDHRSLFPFKKDIKYFLVWRNNDYYELGYLKEVINDNLESLSFEYVETGDFLALLFHKRDKSHGIISAEKDRWQNEIRFDCIVSKHKDIIHEGVFTYFGGEVIVVDDGETTVVYDCNFEVIYEKAGCVKVWEVQQKAYLLFLDDGAVYDLSKRKEIGHNSHCGGWDYAWAYKGYIILYKLNYYHIERRRCYYSDDDWGYENEREEAPIRNTFGRVYNASFDLVREFNVIGGISEFKEFGNSIVMKVNSTQVEDCDTYSYYDVKGSNLTRYNKSTDEFFSIPDISCRLIYHNTYVVKVKTLSSDILTLLRGKEAPYIEEKSGVYVKKSDGEEMLEKIIDCKYDYIEAMPLRDDHNIYYAGVIGKDENNKCDLYINHKLILEGIPYYRGNSLNVMDNCMFIKFTGSDGKNGIIRDGKIIIRALYKDIDVQIRRNIISDLFGEEEKRREYEYLFIVSDGKLYGICSSLGKLVIPIVYKTIDIDNNLLIVLERSDDKIEVGWYDERDESIILEPAEVKNGVVVLDDNYIWKGRFIYTNEGNGTGWENYSHNEAMYDALRGEMDAIWNID